MSRAFLQRNNTASGPLGSLGVENDNDVVIVSALRTAIGKARRGGFAETTPDELLKAVFEATMERSKVPYSEVGNVTVGNVQMGGSYAGSARMAQLRSGFPVTVPLNSVNRQCSSGLQAIADVAGAIVSGSIDAGIGAGVESMSYGGGVQPKPGEKRAPTPANMKANFEHPLARQALSSMGQTSENVAERYGITREMQDSMAYDSNMRALRAQKEGRFKREIVPVKTTKTDKATGKKIEIVVDADEGPRASTTMEGLAKLKPAFKENGTSTAGNSSQVSDGAAAVLLMKRSKAKALGAPIIGSFRGYKVVGVNPDEMGIGPAVAIPPACEAVGITPQDVDVYEINEAFASQAAYCVKKLNIDWEKVNPNGGAIALGHPLGMTGARQVATLLAELHRTKKKVGCVSMCIGTGMGMAAIIEAEGDSF
jgi:acetyl-CoA acyltransferase 1